MHLESWKGIERVSDYLTQRDSFRFLPDEIPIWQGASSGAFPADEVSLPVRLSVQELYMPWICQSAVGSRINENRQQDEWVPQDES